MCSVLKIVAMLRRGELQAAGVGEQVGDAGAWVMRTAASAAAYSLTVIVVTIIFSNIATRTRNFGFYACGSLVGVGFMAWEMRQGTIWPTALTVGATGTHLLVGRAIGVKGESRETLLAEDGFGYGVAHHGGPTSA